MQSSHRRPAGRAARAALRLLEFLAWTAFFAFAAVFLALRFWLLPQVENYRGEVVAALSSAIGLPVSIDGLSAEWDGLHPRLTVTNLRIADLEGRDALLLPVVEPVVGWTTLLAGELRLHSLTIEGPRLAMRRAADGTLWVAGIALGARAASAAPATPPGEGRLADWILEQREIIVRDAEIEWRDELRGAPPLALRSLQFRLRNSGTAHRVGLSARPPPELGAGLELRALLRGRGVGQIATWNGRVYAELGYTDLAGWRAWIDYPIEVTRGQGALRLWATFGAGKLVDATADLALVDVNARLAPELPALALTSVAGRVQGRGTARGYEFGARRLALVPVEGLPMQGTTFRASWEAGAPPRGSLSADAIELEPLAQIAEYLPFPADLRALLADLSPAGRVSDADFEWTGRLPDEARFRARARFEGLAMRAWRAVPGFRNLTGRVEASESRGALTLAARDAEVELPRVFPEPRVALAELAGNVSWERLPQRGLSVRLAQLRFANADAAGSASGVYAWPGEGRGAIDLSAQLQRADLQRLDLYLPRVGILGEKTREWLVRAIRGGRTSDARLRLRGNLADFPFRDPATGQFEILAQLRDGLLAFAPGWPEVRDIEGELRIERDRLEVNARRARVLGAEVRDARAAMPLASGAVLAITGRAEGPSAAFVRYLRESPLRRALGDFVDELRASGDGRLRLDLRLPLAEVARYTVDGEYAFEGNTLRLGDTLPPVERAAGTLAFTGKSVQVRNATGRLAGGALRVQGGTQEGGDVVLNASGSFTVAALARWLPEGWRERLGGAASYAGSVRLRRESAPRISVESDLVGVMSDLPPPLAKAGGEARLLRVTLGPAEAPAREHVRVTLDRLLRAEFERRREGGARVLERAGVAFNQPPGAAMRWPQAPARVLFYGALPHLDLDRWLGLLGGGGRGGGEGGAVVAEMRVDRLDAFGRRLEDVEVAARVQEGGWTASVESPAVAGDIEYRSGPPRAIRARMARFTVPEESPDLAPGDRRARDLPDLDLIAEDFRFRRMRPGRVELLARHEGPVWKIERLATRNPDGAVQGHGEWRPGENGSTALDLQFEAANVGGMLARLGYPDLVKAGKANGTAQLTWNGEPAALDYPSLAGEVKLHAEQGQFLRLEPGIGKLISLMSLQNLPRRVIFDFGDVFSKGFQWDAIDATARIERGVLDTQDFKMTGGAAEVDMQGRVDLAAETQDLRVRVVPGLDGTASTVTGVLVNPPAGLAALLAQKLLRNPLGQMFAYRYAITGDWASPQVVRLQMPTAELPKPGIGD